MNTFHDLFRQPTRKAGAGSAPDRRRELFPGFVERSPRLRLWVPGQSIPAQGSFLLIGVATWSGYDMNLLDLIEETADRGATVEVLDVDAVSAEELGRLFSGVTLLQTPFVAHCVDGKLAESASGFEGRKLVARVCGLNLGQVEDRMKTVTSRV